MALLGWIARIVAILIVVRFLFRMIAAVTRATTGVPPASGTKVPRTREGGRLVRDPQCGTHVPADRAIAASVGGEQVYFCSSTCRDMFVASNRSA